MTRPAVFVALWLVLTGCTTTVERVEIPVLVPCRIVAPAEPAWATELLAPDAGIWEQVRALLAERRQRIGYDAQMMAAIESCR